MQSYLAKLEQEDDRVEGYSPEQLYNLLEREHAEVLSELDRHERGDHDAALRMAALLWRFWMDRGHLSEGRARLARILAAAPDIPSASRAAALQGAGTLAFRQGDNAAAIQLQSESLRMAQTLPDRKLEAGALGGLARCALRDQRTGDAAEFSRRSMAIWREIGDERGLAGALHVIAYTAYIEGDDDRARQLFEESIAVERRLGNLRATAADLTNLGSVETRAGRLDRAARLCAEALRIALQTNSAYLLPYCVANIGGVHVARGNAELGARLLAAAEAMFERSQATIDPGTAIEIKRHCEAACAQLGEIAFQSAWNAGRAIQHDRAIALAAEGLPGVVDSL